jgi:hypothetical protein
MNSSPYTKSCRLSAASTPLQSNRYWLSICNCSCTVFCAPMQIRSFQTVPCPAPTSQCDSSIHKFYTYPLFNYTQVNITAQSVRVERRYRGDCPYQNHQVVQAEVAFPDFSNIGPAYLLGSSFHDTTLLYLDTSPHELCSADHAVDKEIFP